MGRQNELLTFILIGIMLLFSYSYVTEEAQDVSDAEPTNNTYAFIADWIGLFWAILILIDLGAALFVISEMIK